jgi:hypothetical protein
MLTINDSTTTIKFQEKDYHKEVQKLIEFIIEIKSKDNSLSLLDLLIEYCARNDISEELMGDAISTDVYFKDLIRKDCELHNHIQVDKPEEW